MTNAKAFVDTNVLLRAMVSQIALHAESEALLQTMWSDQVELWISRQIIREYLVQVTHPNTFALPLTTEQVLSQVEMIQSLFHVADDTGEVTAQLLALIGAHPTRGKQIHDANVVATMLANGIDTLLTINVEDMRRFADKIKLLAPTP
ncbi:MAG: PIN domain-containing protein [Anaerolineae bacterium]|nr:PIN domain-containing protein [Anaerolineae bacterium]